MSIHTAIFPGDRGHVIHRGEHGQELIGPLTARITVIGEPDLCPYTAMELVVDLIRDRYEITELRIETERHSPIAVRGLQTIKFPEIVRRALLNEVTIRRTTEYGAETTGVGPDDEVPLVYLLARAVGENPTEAVQEAFKLPTRQAAAQRVARARKAGRIPPTTKGAR